MMEAMEDRQWVDSLQSWGGDKAYIVRDLHRRHEAGVEAFAIRDYVFVWDARVAVSVVYYQRLCMRSTSCAPTHCARMTL